MGLQPMELGTAAPRCGHRQPPRGAAAFSHTGGMSKAWAKGSSRRWRQVRAVILANNLATNQGKCTLAIEGVCTGQAECVHHELGKAAGDDPRYLKPVCNACNWKIGNPAMYDPKPKRMTRW